jgi:hypothetical protein
MPADAHDRVPELQTVHYLDGYRIELIEKP